MQTARYVMEQKSKLINKILKDFLIGEAEATDMRIMSIRHFLVALNDAVDSYIKENVDEKDREDSKILVAMLDDMAEIYRNEISDLLVKRGKLQHYMNVFKNNKSNMDSHKKIVEEVVSQSNYIN